MARRDQERELTAEDVPLLPGLSPFIHLISSYAIPSPSERAAVLDTIQSHKQELYYLMSITNPDPDNIARLKSLHTAVTALASIPSREVLIAQLLGVMQAPVSGFARVLAAVAAQKGEGSAAPAEETAAAE